MVPTESGSNRDTTEAFPNGTFATDTNLIDAVVYGTDDDDATGLLDVLTPDQIQLNEGPGNNGNAVARVPDGGAPFNIDGYVTQPPSPGRKNEVSESIDATAAPLTIAENAASAVTLTISRTGSTDRTVEVTIEIDDPSELTGPDSATLAIGASSVSIDLTPVDDAWPDGDQVVNISLTAQDGSLKSGATAVTVTDDGADTQQIVINEIHAAVDSRDGDANKDGILDPLGFDEFVEIVNVTGASLDLGGFTLSDAFAVRHTFPAGTVLDPDCAVVVFGGGNIAEGILPEFGNALVQKGNGLVDFGLGLNDAGDFVSIANVDGFEVASASWGDLDDGNGSLTRQPDITGDFIEHIGTRDGESLFSPGTKVTGEPFCDIVNAIELAATPTSFAENAGVGAAQLTITRTGPTDAALLVALQSNDTTEATVQAEATIPIGSNTITVPINAVDDGGPDGDREVSITGSAEGFVSGTVTVTVTDDGDPPVDVVINEIDPDQAGTDASEFVELYDGGKGNVPLDGLVLVVFQRIERAILHHCRSCRAKHGRQWIFRGRLAHNARDRSRIQCGDERHSKCRKRCGCGRRLPRLSRKFPRGQQCNRNKPGGCPGLWQCGGGGRQRPCRHPHC